MFAVFIFALSIVGYLEAKNCLEHTPDAISFTEVMKKNSQWVYVLSNHKMEDCHNATYEEVNQTMGKWIVGSKDGVNPMHCLIKIPSEGGKPLEVRVQEAGAGYSLLMTGYTEGKGFCWYQCDTDGVFVDFYHCFAADAASAKDGGAASAKAFTDFLAKTEMKLGPFTNLTTPFNDNCAY